MSVASYIEEARVLVSDVLKDAEDSTHVNEAPYSPESVKNRKWYWNCSKASRTLADLAAGDLPIITEEDLTNIKLMQQKTPDFSSRSRLPTSPPIHTSAATAPRAVPIRREPVPTAVVRQPSQSSAQASAGMEKLSMDGFKSIDAFLRKQVPDGSSGRRSSRPYVSLGDLGMREGWTTILTNAAFCYDNTPAEGWRREVAIRMGGKSRGSVDIHYVTPDKTRRFRSRQELQSYLNRMSSSIEFINNFDFRAVFCACHRNEDHTRSYLECSYGLAGCNRWVHPECMGLGVRSEQELALMPKVICPFCTAYLEGSGELSSVRTPDMLVLRNACWDPQESHSSQEDEIEASALPHVLWGLQGTPYVYCGATGLSGLDHAPSADTALAEPVAVSLSARQRSPPAVQTGAFATIPDAAQPPELSSILQHRLFQGWTTTGSSNGDAASGADEPAEGGSKRKLQAHLLEEEDETIGSDEDDGVPSNRAQLEPVDRVRRARHADGRTSLVRVVGGWMPHARSAAGDPADRPALGSPEDADATGEMESADSMKRRILEKAAARVAGGTATSSGLAGRYKNEVIEGAVNTAQSSSHKKRTTFTQGTITAVAAGHATANTIVQTRQDLRASYQAKPSLCFLPMEDGGLRFASVSFAQVPRSVHPLCLTSLMCGACLTYNDHDGEAAGAGKVDKVDKADKGKKGGKKGGAVVVTPEVDRYQLTQVACGAVRYPVHKQCVAAVAGDFLTGPSRKRRVSAAVVEDADAALAPIQLLAPYAYETAEDAECDLCGRKGGIMRYFRLSEHCSSVAPPAEEGWLAHIPCIQFLSSSQLLQPLGEDLGRFDCNPLSCQVSAGTAGTAGTAGGRVGESSATKATLSMDVEEGSEGAGSEQGGEEGQGKLLEANLLSARPPRSRFDQLLGHWRCTLCGLQCGVAVRCVAAGCTVRVHPLCVTAVSHPFWRTCAVAIGGGGGGKAGKSKGAEEAVSVGVLCPLHSVGVV